MIQVSSKKPSFMHKNLQYTQIYYKLINKKILSLNCMQKKEFVNFINSTSNDPHEIDYHPFSIHDGITELPQNILERFDDFPLLLNAFVESYSFNSLNPDEKSYYSLFFVSNRELEDSEYIRLSLNNALFNPFCAVGF